MSRDFTPITTKLFMHIHFHQSYQGPYIIRDLFIINSTDSDS